MNSMNSKNSMNPITPILVSVIVVNWNGKHLLAECLGSLVEQEQPDVEIILVDNGSTDGSAAYVRETYPAVRLLELPENLGFAGGNNAGIRIARGKYIALLNNDTRTDRAWLSRLVSEAESGPSSVGMWASKILSYDHPDTFDNIGLLLYPDGLGRGKGRLEKDQGQYDAAQEAFFPSGCAALYRASLLGEIGLLDEDFFAYADDVDIGLRARWAGWKCRYVPGAIVYHKYSASSSAYSPFKAYLVERNRIWVLLKYFPLELILISPLFTLQRMILHLFGAMSGKGASGRFSEQQSLLSVPRILLRAWGAVLLSLPRMVRQRMAGRLIRRINRREFYRLLCTYRISAREVALKE